MGTFVLAPFIEVVSLTSFEWFEISSLIFLYSIQLLAQVMFSLSEIVDFRGVFNFQFSYLQSLVGIVLLFVLDFFYSSLLVVVL